jgi:hypothetical protein
VLALATAGCVVASQYMTTLEVPQPLATDPSAATVVFAPSGYGGGLKKMILDDKGRFLGESWGKTYFAVKVPPGEHTFIEAAGQAYFAAHVDEVSDVVRKGVANYATYQGDELERRTMLPGDGVPAPVQPVQPAQPR